MDAKSYLSPRKKNVLHLALENIPPIKVVKMLLANDSSSNRCVDDLGLTPLHVACCCMLPLEIINLLIEYDERDQGRGGDEITTMRDLQKNTPLHHAVKALCDPFHYDHQIGHDLTIVCNCGDLEESRYYTNQILIIKKLVLIKPQLVHMQDTDECTPIEILEDSTSNWEKIALSVILGDEEVLRSFDLCGNPENSNRIGDRENRARRPAFSCISVLLLFRKFLRSSKRNRGICLKEKELLLHRKVN